MILANLQRAQIQQLWERIVIIKTFTQIIKEKTVYVATSELLDDYDNVRFVNKDIVKVILKEKKREGKDIFLFGGGKLVDSFIKADIIDEYIIGIIPTILGKGRPLFLGNNPKIDLKLDEYVVDNGIVICRYSKR